MTDRDQKKDLPTKAPNAAAEARSQASRYRSEPQRQHLAPVA